MIERALTYGRMVKFSHTVFALPFALAAVIIGHRYRPVRAVDLFWITVAMVGARSAAMGFNRLADAKIDARNPRTARREIPSGEISKAAAAGFTGLFSALFIFAAAMLGPQCLALSLPVLTILFGYSFSKRFTWLSHLYLGLVISLAPLGAWLALVKTFSWPVLLLSLALMTHITGFDILYACQDHQFDRNEGLHSIPVRFGIKNALIAATFFHLMSFTFFILIYFAFQMGPVYLAAVAVIGFLFITEHWLINPDDLSRINISFFHINSIISIVLFCGVLGDELYRRWA